MSIDNAQELIPPAKNVDGFDVIGKYRNSLEVLKRERKKIENYIKEHQINNKETLDKIDQLDNKIDMFETLIKEWDEKYGNK